MQNAKLYIPTACGTPVLIFTCFQKCNVIHELSVVEVFVKNYFSYLELPAKGDEN